MFDSSNINEFCHLANHHSESTSSLIKHSCSHEEQSLDCSQAVTMMQNPPDDGSVIL